MQEYVASLLVGLSKAEQIIVLVLFHLEKHSQFGEVPGRNLRTLLDTTKEQLFLELEKLLQKNILKFSTVKVEGTVYLTAGTKGFYIFNPKYKEWQPTADSSFYKICRLLGYAFNRHSYLNLLNDVDFRKEFSKDPEVKDKRLTPFELFDLFCQMHQRVFSREYLAVNQGKDLQTLKKIIFELSFAGYSEEAMKDFMKWCFLAKAREFKTAFIIGFLPLCLKDYIALNNAKKLHPGYIRDEDGRLRVSNENKQP